MPSFFLPRGLCLNFIFFFSSRRRHTSSTRDWSSDVCSSDLDPGVRQVVIEAGFGSAAAVKNAFSHDLDDPFAIARITIMAGTSTKHIGKLLDGRGAPRAWSGERRRTQAHRAYRRMRRRLQRKAERA